MDLEKERLQEGMSGQQNEGNREGYRSEENISNEQTPQRTQRPRIQTQRAYSSEGAYRSDAEKEFRPEGFGAGLGRTYTGQRTPRPRMNPGQGTYRQGGGVPPRMGRTPYNTEGGQRPYQQRPQRSYRQPYGHEEMAGGYPRRPQDHPSRYNAAPQEGDYGQPIYGEYNPAYHPEAPQRPYRPYHQEGYQPYAEGDYVPRPQGRGRQPYHPGQMTGGYQPSRGYNQPKKGGKKGGKRGGAAANKAKNPQKIRIDYQEEHIDPNEPIRLNKFLANAGICSRREADQYIQTGFIKVNGKAVTELGTKVCRTDEILYHDKPISLEKKVYVLLNKPKDCVTTSDDPQQRKTVLDIVKNACPERIYPVGRLDRNTTGVLLLTNDGDLASKLTHPKFLKKKVYHVFLDKRVTAHDLQQIRDGIELEDGEVHADAIEYTSDSDKTQVGIEIHSGKNRIVRRIFEKLGYRVVKLDRVQFAGLTKKNVRRGDWRFLTEKEVEMLRMGAFE
ncbi:MAG: pseudouridine synthase [Prevotella sp.]|nr:pseudouridine synthase [Prevotella sp.]